MKNEIVQISEQDCKAILLQAVAVSIDYKIVI